MRHLAFCRHLNDARDYCPRDSELRKEERLHDQAEEITLLALKVATMPDVEIHDRVGSSSS